MALARRLAATTLLLGAAACGGDPPTPPAPVVARVVLSDTVLLLRQGESRAVTATAVTSSGATVAGAAVAWVSADPQVASVAPASGLITAVASGQTRVTATSGSATASVRVEVERTRVATVRLSGDLVSGELLIGSTATVRAEPLDPQLQLVPGWPVTYRMVDPGVASVTPDGVVRGLRAGSTSLQVTIDTVTVTTPVRVRGSVDLAVTGLSLAQVVQDDSGTVPLIRGGLPVVVNLDITADAPIVTRAWVRASCRDAGGLRWADSARLDLPVAAVANRAAPAIQLRMPSDRLVPGLGCFAELDNAAQVPDSNRANNRWPRNGTQAVPSVDVPALDVTFIPIILGGDNGSTGNVSAANLEAYLQTVRAVLPLARINARVGAPFSTSTTFGGGGEGAWVAILRELEAKRQLDRATGHYYGVIRPGPGITFVQFGGFGFISGRTAMSIQVGWFTRESQARELVAHELGHNFGRLHSPCGGAAGADPSYPYADAGLGARGWDVFSVAQSPSVRAPALGAEARDVMSYCRPVWISDYTYKGMIAGREILGRAAPAGEVLLVRGTVDGATVRLDPVHAGSGATTPEAEVGADVDLLDAGGNVVASRRVALLRPDHGGALQLVAALPQPVGTVVSAVRVRTPQGARAEARLGAGREVPVTSRRIGDQVELRWDASRAEEIMVRRGDTGEVLGFGRGGRLLLQAAPAELEVSVGNGRRQRLR